MNHQVFTANGSTYFLHQIKPLRYTLGKMENGVVVDVTHRFQSLTGYRLNGLATYDTSEVLATVQKTIKRSELAI